jgi:hypothetical protein
MIFVVFRARLNKLISELIEKRGVNGGRESKLKKGREENVVFVYSDIIHGFLILL